MARISTLPVRDGVLDLARADAAVLALLPASSIYPGMQPAKAQWPFVRWGAPSATVLRAVGVDGQVAAGTLHIFSKGKFDGDTLLQSAEDHADVIATAVAAAVDKQRFAAPGGTARVLITSTIGPMRDRDTADGFHVVLNLSVRCVTG